MALALLRYAPREHPVRARITPLIHRFQVILQIGVEIHPAIFRQLAAASFGVIAWEEEIPRGFVALLEIWSPVTVRFSPTAPGHIRPSL